MADKTLTKKSDLADLVLRIIRRTGATPMEDETDNIITLAEAGLNRALPAVETDTPLTGVLSNRRIDITSISLVKPIALFQVPTTGRDVRLQQQADGSITYREDNGFPTRWAIDGTGSYIDFDCPLDTAYTFRFRNVQRFHLATDAATNWLLTNHPDVYVAACVVWGYARMEDVPNAAQWSQQLGSGIAEVKHELAQLKRGMLRVDPALSSIGRRPHFNINTGDY